MRVKTLKVNNVEVEATLMCGGPNFKVYSAKVQGVDGFVLTPKTGKKAAFFEDSSVDGEIIAQYVMLKYQNINDIEKIKSEFDSLVAQHLH